MRSPKIVAASVLALLMGLLAFPADAAPSANVSVNVRANGILDINGDNGDNGITICQIGDGEYEIEIDGGDTVPVSGVTKDIRINMRGGNDRVLIDCSNFSAPRDLRVLLGAGDDMFLLAFAEIGDDLTVLGGSGDDDVAFGFTEVADRVDINTSSGPSEVGIAFAGMNRLTIRGGSSTDIVTVLESDIGISPRVYTNSGDDEVAIEAISATGRKTVNTGNGDDSLEILGGEEGCVECDEPSRTFKLNVIMGGGDDATVTNLPLMAGDRLNGGAGNGDRLEFIAPGGATINGYEFFGPYVPPTTTTTTTTLPPDQG